MNHKQIFEIGQRINTKMSFVVGLNSLICLQSTSRVTNTGLKFEGNISLLTKVEKFRLDWK